MTAAAFRGMGIRSEAVEVPDFPMLMLGRANTSCKECLPLIRLDEIPSLLVAALALHRFDDVEDLRGVFFVGDKFAEMPPCLERTDAAGLAVRMNERSIRKRHARLHCRQQLTIL